MSRRTVAKIEGPAGSNLWARVQRDTEWDEFVVTFHAHPIGRRVCPEADYHTGDRQDAEGTARAVLDSLSKVAAMPAPPEYLEALRAFARYAGRQWREKLREGWYRAYYGALDREWGGVLQNMRNHPSYGPGTPWLDAITLPEDRQ